MVTYWPREQRLVLRPDEKDDFFKWVTKPIPEEMEEFIGRIKDSEQTFYFNWKPEDQNWLTEEEMKDKKMVDELDKAIDEAMRQEPSYDTSQYVSDVKTETLRQSLRELQKENIAETKEDIKEIGRKRMLLFRQIADLHKKEILLVARQRAVQLESVILDETF